MNKLEKIKKALERVSLVVAAYGQVFHTEFAVERYATTQEVALELVMTNDRENPFCTLTCNVPGTVLADDEVLIKTWSENEETAKAALNSGLFVDTGKRVSTSFVLAQIWRVVL